MSVFELAQVKQRLGGGVTVPDRDRIDQWLRAGKPAAVKLSLDVVDGLQSLLVLARLMDLHHDPAPVCQRDCGDDPHARLAKEHLRDADAKVGHAELIEDRIDFVPLPGSERDLLNDPAALDPRTFRLGLVVLSRASHRAIVDH